MEQKHFDVFFHVVVDWCLRLLNSADLSALTTAKESSLVLNAMYLLLCWLCLGVEIIKLNRQIINWCKSTNLLLISSGWLKPIKLNHNSWINFRTPAVPYLLTANMWRFLRICTPKRSPAHWFMLYKLYTYMKFWMEYGSFVGNTYGISDL